MHTDLPASSAPAKMARSAILARLRAETAEQHSALEARLPWHEIHISRTTYCGILTRFWGFYAPLERRLLESDMLAQPQFDYRERLKTPKLQQDLYDLGEAPDLLSRTHQCDNLPSLVTLSQLLGCLYVVEGATLGGQIIARQLHTQLGLNCDVGAQFFNGYGSDTGAHWRATCGFLTTMAAQLEQDNAIVASANATFDSLERWVAAAPLPQ